MDCLWNKSHQPVWSCCFADMIKRGRPQPLAVTITILLFSCLPATWASLCKFFFLSSAQTDSSFSCLGKSQQENAQGWWGREGRYIGSFLCLFSNTFSFLFEGVVISVMLVNAFYIYRVLTFIIFYRNLQSAANSPSSQLLIFSLFYTAKRKLYSIFQLRI